MTFNHGSFTDKGNSTIPKNLTNEEAVKKRTRIGLTGVSMQRL
jgi:hypothetical protein